MRALAPVGSALLASLAAFGLWAWLGRPVVLVDAPDERLDCVSYTPTWGESGPLTAPDYALPPGQIERDLAALRRWTGCVRTYASTGPSGEILPAAAREGMEVLLGIWVGPDEAATAAEIEAALALAARHPESVRAIVVGNEVLLRREIGGERLAEIIRSVSARTSLPITYADMTEWWAKNLEVADAVDRITIHVLPYWADPTAPSVGEAQAWVDAAIAEARRKLPGKPIEIGEIGWPSAGRTRGHANPSRLNQARFVREVAAHAERLGVRYNVIEAIDQPWKKELEGTVGGAWGILDAERRPKFPLAGPVRAWEDWPIPAALSAGLAAAFVAFAFAAGARPGSAGWIGVALSGAATASAAWVIRAQGFAYELGPLARPWILVLLAITAGGGGLLAAISAGARTAALPVRAALARTLARRLDLGATLGLFRGAVRLVAAMLAAGLAFDGRYRDFWTVAFVLPALGLALAAWRGDEAEGGPEDAWASLWLLVAGPLAVDSPGNLEALGWAATCLLLAVPGIPAIGRELAVVRDRIAARGERHAAEHQRAG